MAASGGGPEAPHRPVLLVEAVRLLAPERGGLFVDATLGLGGHSEAILEASADARVLGIDRDLDARRLASKRLARFGPRFSAAHANFRDIARVMREAGEPEASGVLADLGVSSLQFDTPERGFSFRHDAPLDMRMDAEGEEDTAAQLLEGLPEEEIARILYEYGEERKSRRIARWIVERRERGEPLRTTGELAQLVARANGHRRGERIHPAPRTIQTLRLAVNRELHGLDDFLETAADLFPPPGRLAVISFHSSQDR